MNSELQLRLAFIITIFIALILWIALVIIPLRKDKRNTPVTTEHDEGTAIGNSPLTNTPVRFMPTPIGYKAANIIATGSDNIFIGTMDNMPEKTGYHTTLVIPR